MRRLALVGKQDVVSNPEQIRPEERARLVARRALEDGDERILRELLGSGRTRHPAPEKPPHRAAIAVEQLFERPADAPLHVAYQRFVGRHRGLGHAEWPPDAASALADTVMSEGGKKLRKC